MKKIGLICVAALMGMALTACGNSSAQRSTKISSSSSSTKSVQKHKSAKKNKHEKKKQSSISSASSSSSQSQTAAQQSSQSQTAAQQNEQSSTQATQTSTTKSQGEINRERGYDPNGASLLPGQDHAAGSNPDGTPDAWVQGQIDWAKQNGYLNSDGTETDKGRAADQEVEQNEQDW
ncbi:hypothetical protein EQG56_10855 [Limosilactobacillus fermentum]|uniref:hypothetical protein n=1 Tax=Limosilactobacillus fermentum TaxID=1613 RepID=UPI000D308278|nr:hypothetical protein [Limosilactobacillus fermentum]PTV36172.1 hypothetical protein DB329_05150 [Limosilactobacillus fermentum]QAR23015.1 hypothetical protein EQG56_00110 [Limosilactobacillus fermentum]QAR24746.1 hypothetical protein EQG56_10855 [Limosilactobacillus fermentum]